MFDFDTISAIAQLVLSIAALIASVAISIFLYANNKRTSRLEYERSVRDAWMAIDGAALRSDAVLATADSIVHPHAFDKSIEMRRKRWVTYMILNPLTSAFFGLQSGLVDEDARQNLEASLTQIVMDDDVFALTQSGAYEPQFRDFCKELRSRPH